MLTIIFWSGNKRTWSKGDKTPLVFSEVDAISMITASGDELERVKETFCHNYIAHREDKRYTIPMSTDGISSWFGDIAKTVAVNIFDFNDQI